MKKGVAVLGVSFLDGRIQYESRSEGRGRRGVRFALLEGV